MIKGNKIYYDLFDYDVINVIVDDVVFMVGEECGVERFG